MKRLCLLVFLLLLMIFAPVTSFADSSDSKPENDYLNEDNYYETIIINGSNRHRQCVPQTFSQTKKLKNKFRKSKITYYKNASGKKLWYVKVTGTFTYRNGAGTVHRLHSDGKGTVFLLEMHQKNYVEKE